MRDVVKLDQFEYELEEIGGGKYDKYTIMHILVDSEIDPVIGDIFNEIKINPHVHVGGRYFRCEKVEVGTYPGNNSTQIILLMIEESQRGVAKIEL